MSNPGVVPTRFYSLDVLRGGLTFFIIFFHWQHFFFIDGRISSSFDRTAQPLYRLLEPLYTQGIYAVDFFFSLSGFIFFWLYGESIGNGRVSGAKYAAFRFSRLYPLHLLTLVIVIIGQLASKIILGEYFVYQKNDTYHFFLNLFSINAWGFEEGYSFNGPYWTVSVEVLMYGSFFLIAFFKMARSLWITGMIALAGIFVAKNVNILIGMGLHSFFIGGFVFLIYLKLLKHNLKHILYCLTPICAVIWVIGITDMYTSDIVAPSLKAVTPTFMHNIVETMNSGFYATLVFIPFSILYLAIAETLRGQLGKRMHVLGDLSYALYLWHFPLQLAFVLITTSMGIERSFYYSITALLLFYAVLFPLSYCSYYCFEQPTQKYLRGRLVNNKKQESVLSEPRGGADM